MVLERGPYYDDSAENKKFIELGRQEYKKLVQAMSPIENYPSKDTQTTKEVDYFAPWAHFYRLPDEMKELILEELYYLCEHNWSYESSDVRPALGYDGFENILKHDKSDSPLIDPFIQENLKNNKFIPTVQSTYYPAHSSMRDIYEIGADNIDFKRIFEKSYRDSIVYRIMGVIGNTKTGFGKY